MPTPRSLPCSIFAPGESAEFDSLRSADSVLAFVSPGNINHCEMKIRACVLRTQALYLLCRCSRTRFFGVRLMIYIVAFALLAVAGAAFGDIAAFDRFED